METTKKHIEDLIQAEKEKENLVYYTSLNGRHHRNFEAMPGHARYILKMNGADWDILEPVNNELVFSIEVV